MWSPISSSSPSGVQHDSSSRTSIAQIVGTKEWKDVTVNLYFLGRMLEQADLTTLSPDDFAAELLWEDHQV
ncbi:unnamed protein product [Peniophora sp. CBMAI 1063]|nr:unnamed protein product [Peniophora sp. CBMAI 1063]